MLPYFDYFILRHPGAANTLNVRYRNVTHNLVGNVGYRASSVGRQSYTSLMSDCNKTHFLTRTQSLNTAFPDPDENVCTFLTGKTGTSPKSSAARERHCTTPVEPKRQRTMSFKFSTRLDEVNQVFLSQLDILTSSTFRPSLLDRHHRDRPSL